jgi:ribosomal-protein-alanine N-acetyltransferase
VEILAAESVLTDRLELRPLGLAGMEALIDRDAGRLAGLFDTDPAVPVGPPPDMDDALPFMADAIRDDPAAAPWWAWIMIRRDNRAVIGSAGFGGRPDDNGTVVTGYAVYPAFEGQGFATECTRGLVAWVLSQPGVKRVQATIPPWHVASIRVVEKVGFRHVGEAEDPEVGKVMVWEIARSEPDLGS